MNLGAPPMHKLAGSVLQRSTVGLAIGSLVVASLVAPVRSAAAQQPLSEARELYVSASYEEALAALTRIRSGSVDAPAIEQIDQYRLLCLFALGRVTEAQAVADDLITKNPALT